MIRTFDTHAHLDHVEGVDQALKEADEAGIEGIVAVGVDLAANQRNLEIKKRTEAPKIFTALGIHPGNINADEIDKTIQFIRDNIREAVAIGEIGLDYWYKDVKKSEEKKQQQRDVFGRQLALAKEFDLPVIVHSRGAWKDCLTMIKEMGLKKANFHWYSGPLDVLDEILACGYFVSATPALRYSPQHQEAVKHALIEQTLIETDSPVYFQDTDEPKGGFAAGPKDVLRTLKLYSALKNIKEEEAVRILNRNVNTFFLIGPQ